MPVLELRRVSRRYSSAHAPEVVALNEVSLRIEQGEFVAIVGPSGGGKSTLLNVLGMLDFPDDGEYLVGGTGMPLREDGLTASIRSTMFAFIFQAFHLLPSRPVRDSVELGLMYRGVAARTEPALAALERVGLADRSEERASHLSGGQQQRAAIARAIASKAEIVLADEPTGNLDSENARIILNELQALNRAGATVIVVTHSGDVASAADRQLRIQDGQLVSDTGPKGLDTSQADQSALPELAQKRQRMTPRDVVSDAWRSIRSRPAQTSALCLAVAIAVSLTLTTLGLSTSAGAQVSSVFDAQLNREVTASWDSSPGTSAAVLADVPERTGGLAGVVTAAGMSDFDPVAIAGVADARAIEPHTFAGDVEAAAHLTVTRPAWRSDGPLEPGEVLIGRQLAQLLELSALDSGPVVTIDHTAYQVAGIIEDSPRIPSLLGEVLLPEGTLGFDHPKNTSAVLLTSAGAAQQVARQVPIAVDPYEPEGVAVRAPTDAKELRVTVEQGVQTALIAFSILAIVVAIAALTNAMLLAVTARRGEIGMRKALGARSRHIAWLLAGESAFIGVVGGVCGLALGILAILAITLTQHWAPVFDLRLGPLAVVAGILIGVLGGTAAATRAARIRPADTLRQ